MPGVDETTVPLWPSVIPQHQQLGTTSPDFIWATTDTSDGLNADFYTSLRVTNLSC